MSQAYNLGKFANTLNTSGQTDVTTGISGIFPDTVLPTIPINKGGTNLTTVGSNNTIVGTDGAAYTYNTASGTITWAAVQTSSFIAVAGYGYLVNTTSSAITITLPLSPTIGQSVTIVDYAGTSATNNITVAGNGANIKGTTSNAILATNRQGITFTYIDSTQGWVASSNVYGGSSPFTQPYTASYLLVAGGGGGGTFTGGGGAGGLVTGTLTLQPGTVYTASVGGGGTGGSFPALSSGSSGSNSTFPGATAAVGGGGGSGESGAGPLTGGSGGGASGTYPGTKLGAAGTPGQGNSGGNARTSNPYGGGGGGGASAVGGTGATAGGNGGDGLASSITGTPATYAGGGGAGYNTPAGGGPAGIGGSGGGGGGGTSPGNTATANTGGGGGGGNWAQNAGNGGSGVVILSVPTANYTGTVTGSPTVTPSGSNTIIKWTTAGSGTYTA